MRGRDSEHLAREAERVAPNDARWRAHGEEDLRRTSVDEVDALIAATGFRPGLEPLVGHLGVLDDRGEPLVHGAEEHPRAPGLHFVGYQVTLGGTFRRIGIQARQLAKAVAASDVNEASPVGIAA